MVDKFTIIDIRLILDSVGPYYKLFKSVNFDGHIQKMGLTSIQFSTYADSVALPAFARRASMRRAAIDRSHAGWAHSSKPAATDA